jgi:hypothetical protein
VAPRIMLWIWGHLLAGFVGSNPAGGHGSLSVVSVVCCQVEFCASGRSRVQRSPTECGVSECDLDVPTRGGCDSKSGRSTRGKKNVYDLVLSVVKGKLYSTNPIYSYLLHVIFLFGFPIKIRYA